MTVRNFPITTANRFRSFNNSRLMEIMNRPDQKFQSDLKRSNEREKIYCSAIFFCYDAMPNFLKFKN